MSAKLNAKDANAPAPEQPTAADCESYFGSGSECRERGELVEALGWFRRCERAAQELDDPTWRTRGWRAIGEVRLRQKQVPDAIEAFSNALSIAEEADDQRAVVFTLPRLARALCDLGRLPEVKQLSQRATEALRHVSLTNDERHHAIGQVLLTTGLVHFRASENRKALKIFRAAIRHLHECGAQFPLAEAHRFCGIMESEARNYLQAIPHFLAALDIYDAMNDRHRRFDVFWSLGVTYVDLGDLQSARHVVREAESIARSLRLQPELGKALGKLADIELREGNYESALDLYQQDLAIAQTYQDPQALAYCHLHLAHAYRVAGEAKPAYTHAEASYQGFIACHRAFVATQAKLEMATARALDPVSTPAQLRVAERLASEANEVFAKAARELGKAEAEFVLGLVENQRGKKEVALRLLNTSIDKQWLAPPTRLLIEARYHAATVCEDLDDRHHAIDHLRNAAGLAEMLGSRDLRDRCIHRLDRLSPVDAQRMKLSPYLPSGAVDELSARWQDIDRMRFARSATIMFIDFRGYTEFSSDHASAEVTEAVDTFLRMVSRIIIQNGGSVDKFIGDCVLATFGLPGRGREYNAEEAARWAVWSALDLLEELELTGRVRAALRLGPLHASVGINTGEVVAGCFGPLSKRDFTVIGYHVNLASRLQSLASEIRHDNENRVLLSDHTYELAHAIVYARKVPRDELHMKGIHTEATEAWMVLGKREDF